MSSFGMAATSTEFRSRKTAVANHPRRLLPSFRAWLFTIDWSSAAAFSQMPEYASSHIRVVCGLAAAEPSTYH